MLRNISVFRAARLLVLSALVAGLFACDAVCPSCGGKGETKCTLCTAGQTDCGICVGGKVGDLPCKFCQAKGTIQCAACGGKARIPAWPARGTRPARNESGGPPRAAPMLE